MNIAPKFSELDSTCTLQITELSSDHSYFDRFQLKAIDHPIGTEVAITESNDIILYFPQLVINPTFALLNDSIVTCSLGYDSSCTNIFGDSSSTIDATMGGGTKNGFRTQIMNNIRFTIRKVLSIAHKEVLAKKRSLKLERDDTEDSIAVIMDPGSDNNIYPVNKEYAGMLSATDTSSNFNSGQKLFARRENRSVVVVPVGKNVYIDSVYTTWYRNFSLGFLCTTPIYYGGYVEKDLILRSATNSVNGDVMRYLTSVDGKYAEMDNQSTISLKFSNTNDSLPSGWQRDYVLVTNGRYVNAGSSGPSMAKLISDNLPNVFRLHQNYPNPFNPSAIIKYDIPRDVKVTIRIFDILGREVKTLVNEFKHAGFYETVFDGTNVASGVYFYRIEAGSFVQSKKMVLIK